MIAEIGSQTFDHSSNKKQASKPAVQMQEMKPIFDWDKAERVDAKYQFMNQGELVFVNFNFKGYKKESDVRYALSDNEILLEVRDEAKNKVHRVCKTLHMPIIS